MIHIRLDSVRIGHGTGAALPTTTLEFGTGVPVAVAVETEQRPTVLSLVASGRMLVDSGSVSPAGLRERVALVDTPLVAEPHAELRVRTVVAEELTFAHLRGSASAFLRRHDLADHANAPMSSLPPIARLRLLTELAVLRPGVEALVLTSPERHGGHPAEWWHVARELAARGLAVLIVTDQASVDAIALLPHPEVVGPDAVPLFDSEDSANSQDTTASESELS